ncbi:hypothetical protein G6F57_017192 [Rhizopus arrhizus]|nr:hypothetical protein G6F57_017192 [Rhizopus arrhizus]
MSRVVDDVTDPHRTAGRRLLGIHHQRAGHRRGGIAAAHAGGIVGAAGHHRVAHLAAGLCIDDAGIGERIAARNGARRQRADQGIARCAAESACVGDATEIQTGTQRVGQRGHRAGARVGHHDRHGKGHRITDRDRAGGTAGLGHRDPRRGHGRSGGAVAAAGGVIGAGTDHGVDHLAAGLRIDGGRVAQTVSSGHGPGRQRAHQRIGGVAGERTGVADTGEIQAGAQGIGQRQQVAGVAIGHGDIDGVAHRRAHRDRAGRVGALGIAYAGHRHGHVAARAVPPPTLA